MSKADLIVFSVIRNGIQNGYPFVENYASWLEHCDQVFVLDGQSTDGTDVVLRQLARMSPKFAFESAPWPAASTGGSAIAAFTNECLRRVRPRAERLLYMQADEILDRDGRRILSGWKDGAVELTRYVLFWNSFHTVLRFENDGARERWTVPWRAIRLFPASADAESIGDGVTFKVGGSPMTSLPIEVFHYGWNFPVNILQKHVSHGGLYSENPLYRRRARMSTRMLLSGRHSPELLEAMDPQYRALARPFRGHHPDCVQHLLGQDAYDPHVGLSLLRRGVSW